jgi:amidohydrolase
MQAQIQDLAAEFQPEVVRLRRHLHQYPELSFEEHQTAAYIADRLRAWGIPHRYPVAETGIIALIEGEAGAGPCIALRADHDALPIQEANEVTYRSQHEGVMHACGHDVHTASLLGTARILWQMRAQLRGSIKLLFQPGEEKLPGGATLLIKAGALENPRPQAIFGQHVHPPLEVGKVGMRPGLYMASADEIYLTIRGKGGHGALPQHTIDPIAISAQVITGLQQLVSRQLDPTIPAVLTFGYIASDGGATNVIPEAVQLKGTLRMMNENSRAEAHQLIQHTATGIAAAFGGRAELRIVKGYPFLKNDEALTARARTYAQEYLGPENVVELPMRMSGEDFAYYSQEMPACFYRLGTGNPNKGITSGVHTPTFDVDENCFRHSTGLMAWMAMQELKYHHPGKG